MIKEEKERISQLNMLTHIGNVIDSCNTIEQAQNSFMWGKSVLYNRIMFGANDCDSGTHQKMKQSYNKAERLVISKYQTKLSEIKTDIIDQGSNIIINLEAEAKQIVSLEKAKELKALGFNKPTQYFYQDKDLIYSPSGLKHIKSGKRKMNHNKYDDFIYSAPTIKESDKFINKLKLENKS